MFIPDSLTYFICGSIGFVFGYFFHLLLMKINQDNSSLTSDEYDDICNEQMSALEDELEKSILDWVRDEYLNYSVMILEDQDDRGIKLVTVYDVDDSQLVQTTKRIWEIINACENDYNVDRRRKFTYIPNVHSHSNTERFFPQYKCRC